MILKHTKTQVKDLDETGKVAAYPNVYNNKDSDGDISMPGSYRKTVQEQRKKIRVFKDHDRYTVLGVPVEINADDEYGLFTVTKFNLEKEVSRDMFTDIKLFMENGLDADLSVGVTAIKRDPEDRAKVQEWKLYEYSFLSSWGANELATVQSIKADKDPARIISLIEKAYGLDYSDTRLREIESLLKSLEAAEPHFEPIDETHIDNLIKHLRS